MLKEEIEALRAQFDSEPSPAIALRLVDQYRQSGAVDEAVKVLESDLAAHPEHVAARVVKGRCHLDLDQPSEAVAELQRVVIDDPANLPANQLLVDAHIRLGEMARARDRFDLVALLGGAQAELEALERRLSGEEGEVAIGEPAVEAAESEAPTPDEPAAPEPEVTGARESVAVDSAEAEPFDLPQAPPATLDVDPAGATMRPRASRSTRVAVFGDASPFALEEWIRVDADAHGAELFGQGLFAPGASAAAAAVPSVSEPSTGAETPTVTLGELYRKQGHTSEAEGIFREILKRQPGNLEAARALRELEKEQSWPLSAEDLLAGGEANGDGERGGRAGNLLRSYRDRLRRRD